MIPITTNEHLVYFMQCGMLRLSRHDLKFLQNLVTWTSQNKSLTTNQVELFDKLVKKYSRQLLKQGITATKISQLDWDTTVIDSDPKYTEAFVLIEQDTIIFRSPFNKKFLNKFSKLEHTYKWNKEDKVYRSPYSVHSLKLLLSVAHEFYPVINYCSITKQKVSAFESLKSNYWNPTLVKINNYYLIASTNQYIDNALHGISLTSNPECLSLLAWHGVTIDPAIINGDPFLEFCSKYITEADVKDMGLFADYLNRIGCKNVLLHGPGSDRIREGFKRVNINIKSHVFTHDPTLENNDYTVLVITRTFITTSPLTSKGKYMKVVHLKNSMPIERL